MTRCGCVELRPAAGALLEGATDEGGVGAHDAVRQRGDSPTTHAWARLLVLVALLVVAGATVLWVGLPDLATLRVYMADAGPLAPGLFVVGYAMVTLLPLPKNAFAALAGAMFGLLLGIVVVLVAALIGAAVAFALSRALGRDAVERLTGGRVERVDAVLSRRGVLAVVGVRLVPVLPFTAINYGAGLTSVRTRDYAIGTALGIVPGTVSFVALGAYGTSPGSWPFVVSGASLVLLTLGGFLIARRPRKRHRRREAIPEGRQK